MMSCGQETRIQRFLATLRRKIGLFIVRGCVLCIHSRRARRARQARLPMSCYCELSKISVPHG